VPQFIAYFGALSTTEADPVPLGRLDVVDGFRIRAKRSFCFSCIL